MSNIGNKIRAGFFATPERQGEYLSSLLSFGAETAIFDPTCGEGHVLKQIAALQYDCPYTIQTYGVELDKRRALLANDNLDKVVQAPIESMIISHNVFGLVFLNPPYDHTMLGMGDEKTDRKEYQELVRNTRYLAPGGIMIFIIPSYRFAESKIARFLASHFEDIAITKFTHHDYDDYRQCIFIGKKKDTENKALNTKLFDFLLNLGSEEFVATNVTPVDQLSGRKQWEVPGVKLNVPTFYSRIENKSEFVESILNNKGFQAFKERTRPKQLVMGGEPIINIAQGQMALLLASGAVNGLIGEGDTLHVVQGLETVSTITTVEHTEHSTITKNRTKRDVSIKIILPQGHVKKLV